MPTRRLRVAGASALIPLLGGALTLLGAYATVRMGAHVGVGAAVVGALFIGTVVAYLYVPHLAIAGTVALFALVPTIKVFVNPQVGAVKDLVCVAAIVAALLLYVFERRRPDRRVALLVLLLLALYVLNAGRAHNLAWAQGVRLMGEPLLLLLVGLVLPNPRRNLRYGLISLVVVGCLVAFYGLVQQELGGARLQALGYSYNVQLRTIGPRLRSFGTLDDPFAYAAFLMFSLAAAYFWMRRGALAWGGGALLLIGVIPSYVRTAVLILIGYCGIELIRRRLLIPALFFIAATGIVAGVTLTKASGSHTEAFAVYTSNGGIHYVNRPIPGTAGVALNGRISAWRVALGSNPGQWLFGRGVGVVGTAAARATYTFTPSDNTTNTTQTQAVDNGYLATVADVGLIGGAVLLAILGRLLMLAGSFARRGLREGWLALAFIACMMLDALTRASFTGFPTAFLGFLLIGITLAAAQEEAAASDAPELKPVERRRPSFAR